MSDSKEKPRPKITIVEDSQPETEKKDEVETPEVKDETPATPPTETVQPEVSSPKKEDVSAAPQTLSQSPKSDKLPFWLIFVTLLFGILLGAGLVSGVFYYQNAVTQKTSDTSMQQEETLETPAPSVSPTAKPVDKTVSIEILNGSGKKGEAGKVEALLKGAGFNETTTGNADSYSFKTTEIATTKDVSAETLSAVKAALKGYDIKVLTTTPTGKADIEITVGSTYTAP